MEMQDSKPTYSHVWQPSDDQELLLRAALGQGDAARGAWEELCRRVNPIYFDTGSQRVFPLLYLNLQRLNIEHPAMEVLSRFYQYHWYRNQVLLRRSAKIILLLQKEGIPTMVLKAIALIPLYYRDPGLRPTSDSDIVVPPDSARAALHILNENGWTPENRPLAKFHEEYLNRHYAHTLVNPQKDAIDLHRLVMSTDTDPHGDDDLWAAAVPIQVDIARSLALCPADQLMHACMHASHWNPVSPVRGIADAYTILKNGEIDWARFLAQSAKRDIVLPMRAAITYLRDGLKADIPATVIASLQQLPVSALAKVQYDLMVHPHRDHSTAVKLWYHYKQYRRLSKIYERQNLLMRFPTFLRDTWNLDETSQVPGYMARFVMRHVLRRSDPNFLFDGRNPEG
jgi:hypothetical protein